jgi:hypothetical protein
MIGVLPFVTDEDALGSGSSSSLNPLVLFLFLSQTTNKIQRLRAPRRLPTTAPIAAGGKPLRSPSLFLSSDLWL